MSKTTSSFANNSKWQTNAIDSDAGNEYKATWLFAILWNALSWAAIILGSENILKAFEEAPVFYIFALFPVIGMWAIYRGITQTLAWRKFGKTPLVMEPFPGQLGGSVAGYVDVPIPYNMNYQVNLSLSCVHQFRRKRGKNKQVIDPIWQDSIVIRPEPAINKTRIRFCFKPDSDLPESKPEGSDRYVWKVHINFPLPGHDFDRLYVIPIFATSKQVTDTASRPNKTTHEKITRVVKPTTTKVPKITRSGDSTSFHYPLFRNKGLAIALIAFGLLPSVFCWFMQQQFSDFLPITSMLMFGLVALITVTLIIFGLYMLLHAINTEVSPRGIECKNKLLGFSFGKKIQADSIADIVKHKSGSSSGGNSTQVWYSLKVIDKSGHEFTVGDSLEGSSYADSILNMMIQSLGSRWSASEYLETSNDIKKRELPFALKMLSKFSSLAFPTAMLYDMRDQVLILFNHIQTLLV